MRIGRIKLTNFLAFKGEHELVLPPGPIGVFARYLDNPRRSNWAGKTALLQAVKYAIDGTHRKRTDDEVIHHGETTMVVELELVGGAADVVIRRTKTRGKPTMFEYELRGGVEARGDDARRAIDQLLQMTGPDLESTLFFEQGDIESVCAAEASARRAVITRWLRLERWTGYGKVAREQQRDAESRLSAAHQVMAQIVARRLPALEQHDAPAIEQDLAEIETQLSFLREEIPKLEKVAAQWRAVREGANEQEMLRSMGERFRAIQVPPDVPAEDVAASAARMKAAHGALEVKRGEAHRTGLLASIGFDGSCPVTRSACPAREHVDGQRASFAEAAREAREGFRLASVELEGATAQAEAVRLGQQTRAAALARRDEMRTMLVRQRERVDAWRARHADVEAVDETHITGQLEDLRKSMEICQRQKADLQLELERIARHERDTVQQRDEIEKWAKLARKRQLVSKALGPTGIVARIASVQLRTLEQRANDLLTGTGLGFVFGWERETQEVAPVCYECGHTYKGKRDKTCPACGAERGMKRRDELEILVHDGSGIDGEDVSTKSGGAKVLVASAIRLAGGMLLREQRGSPMRFALVDEPFGALDVENKTLLARTFAGFLGSVGLEQALVVSHDEALLEALPVKIVVIRDGSSSRLVLEGA